jgi:catalase
MISPEVFETAHTGGTEQLMSEERNDEQGQEKQPVLTNRRGHPVYDSEMRGSGVNTYKMVNAEGEAVLVKSHFCPKQDERNLTQAEADQIGNFNHATQDLYEAIEQGRFPEWEMFVQLMSDDPHEEKDHTPFVSGNVVRQKIEWQNNYGQASALYRAMKAWERDELISNLVNLVGQCDRDIQERMVSHLSQCDEEYGRRVAEGRGMEVGTPPTADTVGAH